MFERFTVSARSVVVLAQEEARAQRHHWIGTEHLVIALAREDGPTGTALRDAGAEPATLRSELQRLAGGEDLDADALSTLGIDLAEVRRSADASFGAGALDDQPRRKRRRQSAPRGHIPFTRRSKTTLELAVREAVHLKSSSIGAEHLLLGVIREGHGLGLRLLTDAGIQPRELRETILERLRGGGGDLSDSQLA
jgi:ATP-dependent Clp protease ATP-binding subunit ClpA